MAKDGAGGSRTFDAVFAVKNTGISFLATGILLFLGAIAATYFAVSDMVVELLVIIITGICVLWCGFRAGRHTGRQGLLRGALAGLIYLGVLYLAGSLVTREISFQTTTALSMVIGVGCGAIGGMMGVNVKTKRKRRN